MIYYIYDEEMDTERSEAAEFYFDGAGTVGGIISAGQLISSRVWLCPCPELAKQLRITVSTLTRIVTAMQQYLGAEGHGSVVVVAVINDVKDLRIILRPELPEKIWKELIDEVGQGVESMPRNGIVLIEEGADD